MTPWDASELNFDVSTFAGVARLFPLPNLVLYPHVMQPLHIYESRYREMLSDALAGDGLITMSVLTPGWETDYESRPPVSEYACLGKVVAHHRLDDGRYNVLLMGLKRVQIIKELAPLRSFRQARVEIVEDYYDFASCDDRKHTQQALLNAFRSHLPSLCELPEQLEGMLTNQLPLGLMTDLAAYAMPLAADIKLQLLGECCVRRRAEILMTEVSALAAAKPQKMSQPKAAAAKELSTLKVRASSLAYPPTFSDN